jgi:hypothetical protein
MTHINSFAVAPEHITSLSDVWNIELRVCKMMIMKFFIFHWISGTDIMFVSYCLSLSWMSGQFKTAAKKEERMNLNCVRETDWHYSSSRAEYPFVFCQSSFMRKCECCVLGVFFSGRSHGRNKSINTQVFATLPNGSCPI